MGIISKSGRYGVTYSHKDIATAKANAEKNLYQTEDSRTHIQCRFENETVWLTQALMAELFQVTLQNLTIHLKAIYAECERVHYRFVSRMVM